MQSQRQGLHSVVGALAAGAAVCLAARGMVRYSRRYDFQGKSILITGGSRGLGLVLARRFAAEGGCITICARNEDELSRAEADLRARGADVLAVQCDITSRQQVEAMVETVRRHFGTVDVLVNNAGVIEVGPLEHMRLNDFETAMRTHFWGPLYTTLSVLPLMRHQGGGRIVNISSVGGKLAVPHLLPYSASKFALVGLSEGLRAEVMKENIYVTTVCPGLMRTGSARNAMFKGRHREEFAWFVTSDSFPATSMSAKRAAMKIVNACRNGQGEVVLSVQAKLAVAFHDLFPSLTSDVAYWIDRLLPDPGGVGAFRVKGADSESPITRSVLTELDRRAAAANNEL